MIALAGAVVIVHPFLATVSEEDVTNALAPAAWTASTRMFRFAGSHVQLADLVDTDWQVLLDELARQDPELQQQLASTTGPAIYFGMAPIPLTLELGRRLGATRRVLPHQQRHNTKSWRWPGGETTVAARVTGAPTTESAARGDVVVRVGCSHPVLTEDVRLVVPYPIAEISVEVDAPHEDLLQCDDDVTAVATKFGEVLDAIARYLPNCETIHLFASVPPALALRMGTEINPTIHAIPIQTYQYANGRTPRYSRAIVLGQPARMPLTPEQQAVAVTARETLRRSLVAVRSLTEITSDSNTWLDNIVGPASAHLPSALRRLGPLGRNRMIADGQVSSDGEADGEFLWNREARQWVIDHRLLAALGLRLRPADLEAAGRLFFLHETVHEKQRLTSANADRIGRLPRVLEEVDYLADVWALVNEYGRALQAGEVDAISSPQFFRERVRVMSATFWAFDAGDLPLRSIQVRRLNRYLIWYWIRIGLETADDLASVMRILGTKPVLELAGPRVRVSDNRVVFDLDPATFGDVELGVLDEGYRIVRVGSRPGSEVKALLEAVGRGDETAFVDALRGVFDSVHGGAIPT